MHDETDETIERITAALRPLPQVDTAQKARVLVAVAAERERERERRVKLVRRWRSAGAVGVVAAAGLVAALMLRSRGGDAPPSAPIASAPIADAAGARAALARDAKASGIRAVQVVLRAPEARRVSVVGDFNDWDAAADAMTRDPASGLWSRTLTLRAGRHVYAFVVDDSVWMRDPRSPEAEDADFGRPGSVLLVGVP